MPSIPLRREVNRGRWGNGSPLLNCVPLSNFTTTTPKTNSILVNKSHRPDTIPTNLVRNVPGITAPAQLAPSDPSFALRPTAAIAAVFDDIFQTRDVRDGDVDYNAVPIRNSLHFHNVSLSLTRPDCLTTGIRGKNHNFTPSGVKYATPLTPPILSSLRYQLSEAKRNNIVGL
jgi:hypothetical protein